MPPGTSPPPAPAEAEAEAWTLENAAAGAAAGFTTVAALHPLDVVRTRFQVSGGRGWSEVPPYRNTSHAVYTIARSEVSLFTNPIWLVKTRLQLQTPKHHTSGYSGFSDALRTILKEEGFLALYRGIGPGLLLNSIDFAALGAGSKVAAILLTYPYQVIRARLQQRPGSDGTPKYSNSWHVVKETANIYASYCVGT
ncbi:hypothetical protein BAE44_0007812 [Dichanthelium oligosanthes]|uniref:Folate transporter 1, chloroplastic n=1 Tax=Dichanthelium oligosanthes TaxID=888268 RepID=A0A1E5W1F8_9POAL|nr:hypothetical protein BAE44_0007812 [Dichanthelium oligosanthes]